MKRQSIHFIVLFLYSNFAVRYQIIASKENSPYHHKNFSFFLKPNSFLIDKISCQGVKKLASTRKKTKFLVVISLRMQVFPITTIRFKNPAKISRFGYSTHSPFSACADKCPLCSSALQYYSTATTELYYISGDRALAKKVWQKTWRISISKVPLKSLNS